MSNSVLYIEVYRLYTAYLTVLCVCALCSVLFLSFLFVYKIRKEVKLHHGYVEGLHEEMYTSLFEGHLGG